MGGYRRGYAAGYADGMRAGGAMKPPIINITAPAVDAKPLAEAIQAALRRAWEKRF